MIEKALKNVEGNKLDALNSLLTYVKKGEGNIPKGFEKMKELEEIGPFFTTKDFFVNAIHKNIKKLKSYFTSEEDFTAAKSYLRAKKVRNYTIQRIEESVGLREIAEGKFENYKIVANRIKADIKTSESGESKLIEKVDYKDIIFTLTSKEGIKKVNNTFYQEMVDCLNKILSDIKKQGYFDTDDLERDIVYGNKGEETVLAFRITCDRLRRR